MSNTPTAQKVKDILLASGFEREERLLERQLSKLRSNDKKERSDAADYIRGLCSFRGLVSLNVSSVDRGEWEDLLVKLVKYSDKQVKNLK